MPHDTQALKALDRAHHLHPFTDYKDYSEHGGRIEVESNEGQGTTLHCYLPVEPKLSESLTNLVVRSQLLEDPRELILEEEGEDLGI